MTAHASEEEEEEEEIGVADNNNDSTFTIFEETSSAQSFLLRLTSQTLTIVSSIDDDEQECESSSIPVLTIICTFIDFRSLCQLSLTCNGCRTMASAEYVWKPMCLELWPELKLATSLEDDPFPIYKSCFSRKWDQESTSMQDLQQIFGRCDWYSCPNGHLYAIGECRIPVMVAKCPECGERIGGKYHRMLDTNHRLGAVHGSYIPFNNDKDNGNGNGNSFVSEDSVQFGDVMGVLNSQRNQNQNNGGGRYALGSIAEERGRGRRNRRKQKRKRGSKSNNTISESEANSFEVLMQQFERMSEAPEYLKCPLSQCVFIDPLVTPNGQIYEREMIEQWLQESEVDPIDSNIVLNMKELRPEKEVKAAADLWRRHLKHSNANTNVNMDGDEDGDADSDSGNERNQFSNIFDDDDSSGDSDMHSDDNDNDTNQENIQND